MIRMAHEGTSRVGNASVHWRKDGSGPAVVFLHGFPLAGETWDAVVHDLRDRFTCYAPDLIGLGRSHSTADDDYSSPGQARTFQELLSQLGVARYALVGNDTGGWIARELALIDRQRVSHLVLTNTEIPRHRPPWIPMYQALAHVPGCGAVIGQVLGLLRDPLSQRVTRLITRYGAGCGRQVAVPIEWIVRRGPRRLVLGVGTRSLDDLPDYEPPPQPSRLGRPT